MVLKHALWTGRSRETDAGWSKAQAGGWDRIIINVDDLSAEVARLRQTHVHFRNEISKGPGGSEILLDDPSGNPIELFQPAP